MTDQQPVRHILSLSGGKDSSALAVYMRDKVPGLEYIFSDTGDELDETYKYLEKLEAYLGIKIKRLNPDRPFKHHLEIFRGVLPDARTRWCTRKLKIEPFEREIGDTLCYNYIGIRADEAHRKGYISTKPNIIPKYPFIENGINREDVYRILEESGLGLPDYYQWRSRSGCYFCFFQRRIEWIHLYKNHPDLFKRAMAYELEKEDALTGERYTWCQGESLKELIEPERMVQVEKEHELWLQRMRNKPKRNQTLNDVFEDDENLDDEGGGCLICHL